jgi:ABC-type Na+ efflux pump permease subunit
MTVAAAPPRSSVTWRRTKVVARTELTQLAQARDFWIPMLLLGSIFFLIIPTILLLAITSVGDIDAVQQISDAIEALPEEAQEQVPATKGDGTPVSAAGRTSYTLAVFLLAPVAVIVPLTISTAVGAATIVGERERGTGEFLAHSPADVKEIYGGKLLASLAPGYFTTIVGFGLYSVIVNLIVGGEVGGWFFPTRQWWILMFWVVPPFLVLTLSLVLRLSARVKSTAAAQQASGLITLPLIIIAYSQSTGALFGAGSASLLIGALAWLVAGVSIVLNLRAVTRARLLGVADEQ